MTVVMKAFDGRGLDRAVHPPALAARSGHSSKGVGLHRPILDAVCRADHVEAHRPGVSLAPIAGPVGALNAILGSAIVGSAIVGPAIVGPDRVDPVRHSLQYRLETLRRGLAVSGIDALCDGELACPAMAEGTGLLSNLTHAKALILN